MTYKEYEEKVQWLNERTKEYDEGYPTVSDKEWDDVYFDVQKFESYYPHYSLESPTQKIHYETVSELKKVTHNHPMLSLAKTKDIDELKSFIGDKPFIAMAKMDGLTCSLTYVNGKLIRAETRGDGAIGEDITHNALVIPSIPKRINYKEKLIVDGEIICRYLDFKKWSQDYKNPRNFASGSIRLLDSEECFHRDLTFVAWDIIEPRDTYDIIQINEELEYETLSLKLEKLIELNFQVVPYAHGHHLNIIEKIINDIKEDAAYNSYPIDGIVIKYNQVKDYNAAGRTDHHFKGGIAYKFYDEEYETRLKYISYDVSRNGTLTPVAVFEPIDIDGTTVERASLHNMSVMYETLGRDPFYGQRIWIKKANQIIPQVVKADIHDYGDIIANGGVTVDRNGIDGYFVCPVCGEIAEIEKSPSGVEVLVCTNEQCEGKLVNILDHFCGKKGLDIKGLSKKTLEKLISWGWLDTVVDIPKLKNHRDEWINKTGFGMASVDKILKAIDDRFAEAPLSSFLSGLGIPLIGSRVSKQICEHIETWSEFRNLIDSNFDFSQWVGFGYEMNAALHNFDYSNADKLVDSITFKSEEKILDKDSKLSNYKFVITGKLQNFKNRQELIDLIALYGGSVTTSLSSNTSFLINNDISSTSAKNKKAKELNIPIISEEEFLRMINE